MITLTNPIPVSTNLGASSKTNYDRLEVTTINYDVVNQIITGACRLVCSTNANLSSIQGSYSIPTASGPLMTVSIPNLPFFASLALTIPQQTTVAGWIASAQNTIEAGLVAVGVATGAQASGL